MFKIFNAKMLAWANCLLSVTVFMWMCHKQREALWAWVRIRKLLEANTHVQHIGSQRILWKPRIYLCCPLLFRLLVLVMFF